MIRLLPALIFDLSIRVSELSYKGVNNLWRTPIEPNFPFHGVKVIDYIKSKQERLGAIPFEKHYT